MSGIPCLVADWPTSAADGMIAAQSTHVSQHVMEDLHAVGVGTVQVRHRCMTGEIVSVEETCQSRATGQSGEKGYQCIGNTSVTLLRLLVGT